MYKDLETGEGTEFELLSIMLHCFTLHPYVCYIFYSLQNIMLQIQTITV